MTSNLGRTSPEGNSQSAAIAQSPAAAAEGVDQPSQLLGVFIDYLRARPMSGDSEGTGFDDGSSAMEGVTRSISELGGPVRRSNRNTLIADRYPTTTRAEPQRKPLNGVICNHLPTAPARIRCQGSVRIWASRSLLRCHPDASATCNSAVSPAKICPVDELVVFAPQLGEVLGNVVEARPIRSSKNAFSATTARHWPGTATSACAPCRQDSKAPGHVTDGLCPGGPTPPCASGSALGRSRPAHRRRHRAPLGIHQPEPLRRRSQNDVRRNTAPSAARRTLSTTHGNGPPNANRCPNNAN
jgi:hypothetical protein